MRGSGRACRRLRRANVPRIKKARRDVPRRAPITRLLDSPIRSELEPEPEADLPLRILAAHARDLPEGRTGEAALRVGEHAVVEEVARLHPELEPLRLRERERTEDGEVEVVAARTVE